MIDPLAEVVTMLKPSAGYFKAVGNAGRWQVRRSEPGQTLYGAMLEGTCRLTLADQPPIILEAGDFVLIPDMVDMTMSSLEPPSPDAPAPLHTTLPNGEFRIGPADCPPDVRALIGHGVFDSPDAGLLVSLLPRWIHVRHEPRLATLLALIRDEFHARRPAREMVLARLLEVVILEALRATGTAALPGLVRGLTDARLAQALRGMHESPDRRWTIAQLADVAALSRSAFFERFNREVGIAPMEYLLTWRMALAKRLLRERRGGLAAIAEQVGYGSASTFSVAFTRHVGVPPSQYPFTPEADTLPADVSASGAPAR